MNTQRVLSGRYELGELIGRGGMADVFRGIDTRLGRTVAVKLLRPDLARDPQFQARFKREAQAVAALNHPSIVAIYDTGDHAVPGDHEDTVRVPYIVMEFVSGKTIRDLIRAKDVSIDQAIDFTLGVLAALDYSHKAGIVHRDIKPANVMFCPESNSVKVMDFGIARAMADSAATMTQTQAVVGTAQYLSPEQARGETVDARSDLYSAGCLLYEMLAGRPPFIGDSPVSVAYQHVREIPELASSLNPDVSEALDSVLMKALQNKPRGPLPGRRRHSARVLRAARSGVGVVPPAASEAATDPHDTIPTPDSTPTAAFSVTGAKFLDETPTGRLRPPQESLADDDNALAAQGVAYDAPDTGSLPLVLPPEREHTPRQKSRRRTWTATLVIVTVLVLAGGGLWLYNMMNQAPPPVAKILVPSVTSLTESEALQKLYNAGLKPQLSRMQHETIAKGLAVGTVPATGELTGTELGHHAQYLRRPQCHHHPRGPARAHRGRRPRRAAPEGSGRSTRHHHGQQRHGPGRHCDHDQPGARAERCGGQHSGDHRVHGEGGGSPACRPPGSRG